jgi:hypothetical protein
MTNRILYTKIFNFLKKKFDLKDICVRFWAGRVESYKCRPYVAVIDNTGKEHCLTIDDKYHMFDYVYVDKFDKSCYISSSPKSKPKKNVAKWRIIEALFEICQETPIYMILGYHNMVDMFSVNKQHNFVFLDKGSQLEEFAIKLDLLGI